MPRKVKNIAVSWLGEEIDPGLKVSNTFRYYKKFQFKKIIAEIGDFVLVSNADTAEPDTEAGCDAARILTLYEDPSNNHDPFRAKVQWYSRPDDLPSSCFSSAEPIEFLSREVLEDHRPFDTDVSIETFFKSCSIILTSTKDTGIAVNKPYHYICRHRLVAVTKRKVQIEPVLEEERNAILLLRTPVKTPSRNIPKTPNSLVKRMSEVSLSEQKNWSVSKNDGTKLLLKRAILTDTIEKNSPKKYATPKSTPKNALKSPKNNRKLTTKDIEDLLSMELQENSDDELPTLIIRQTPCTPKRKTTLSKAAEGTEKNVSYSRRSSRHSESQSEHELSPVKRTSKKVSQETKTERVLLHEDKGKTNTIHSSSNRVSKNPVIYLERELLPVKRLIKKASYRSTESSDEELPTLIIRQHVPTTPKRKASVSKISEGTPKKVVLYNNESSHVSRSRRSSRNSVSHSEPELSPVKRTPRNASRVKETEKATLFDDEEIGFRTTRSGRVSRIPTYLEQELSPVKRTRTPRKTKTEEFDGEFNFTPKKSTRKVPADSDNEYTLPTTPRTPRTPKVPRTPRTPRTSPGMTPKRNITKRILTSQLTPSLHSRAHPIDNIDGSVYENKSLPGREKQMEKILSFVRTNLLEGISRCMYISGVPGTGKTATVNSALSVLKDAADLPDFVLLEVNGLKIAEPRQAYVQIYKQLTGKRVVWEQACSLLDKRFTTPGPRRSPTVLVVDEYLTLHLEVGGLVSVTTHGHPAQTSTPLAQLDALCTRRQEVLYSIVEWAARDAARLTVLAVANTMDLPERMLLMRVASRAGITRLGFPPYSHAQLQRIVETRLCGVAVTPDALQLVARKVAAVSGDARRALALCARAVELAGPGGAGLREVEQALDEASARVAVRAIQSCSPAERLMLRAVAAEVERTGSDETTLSRALCAAGALAALDGRPYRAAAHARAPAPAQALAACARLAALRLLLLQPRPAEPRLLLNVSADDVHYAMRQLAV